MRDSPQVVLSRGKETGLLPASLPNIYWLLTKGHVRQAAEGGVVAQPPLPEAIAASPGPPECTARPVRPAEGTGSSGSVCCEGNNNSQLARLLGDEGAKSPMASGL